MTKVASVPKEVGGNTHGDCCLSYRNRLKIVNTIRSPTVTPLIHPCPDTTASACLKNRVFLSDSENRVYK